MIRQTAQDDFRALLDGSDGNSIKTSVPEHTAYFESDCERFRRSAVFKGFTYFSDCYPQTKVQYVPREYYTVWSDSSLNSSPP